MQERSVSRTRSAACLLIAAAVLAFFVVSEPFEGLEEQGMHALGILAVGVILWATEALPMAVVALASLALLPTLGVLTPMQTWSATGNMAGFFAVASFAIAAALGNTQIPKRIIKATLNLVKGSSKGIVMSFAVATGVLSWVIADIAATVLFLGLASSFMSTVEQSSTKSYANLGKCLMIVIPAAAYMGGLATPAGSAQNVLIISFVQQQMGVEISFLEWCAVGFPLAIIGVLLVGLSAVFFLKPETVDENEFAAWRERFGDLGRVESNEAKFIAILCVMCVCWVSSTWVPSINIVVVAILGAVAMFLPGIELLTGREFMDHIQPEPLTMIFCCFGLATGVQMSGVGEWFVQLFFGLVDGGSLALVAAAIAVLGIVLHIAVPSAPAVAALFCVPAISIAMAVGMSPIAIAILLSIWCGTCLVWPIDGQFVLSAGYGYWRFPDVIRFGWAPTLALITISAALPLFI